MVAGERQGRISSRAAVVLGRPHRGRLNQVRSQTIPLPVRQPPATQVQNKTALANSERCFVFCERCLPPLSLRVLEATYGFIFLFVILKNTQPWVAAEYLAMTGGSEQKILKSRSRFLHALHVRAGRGVDFNNVAIVHEHRHLNFRAGFNLRGFSRVAG